MYYRDVKPNVRNIENIMIIRTQRFFRKSYLQFTESLLGKESFLSDTYGLRYKDIVIFRYLAGTRSMYFAVRPHKLPFKFKF